MAQIPGFANALIVANLGFLEGGGPTIRTLKSVPQIRQTRLCTQATTDTNRERPSASTKRAGTPPSASPQKKGNKIDNSVSAQYRPPGMPPMVMVSPVR